MVTDELNTLEVVTGTECHSPDQVFELFEQAQIQQEEGVIVKDLSSTYRPSERSANYWIKLKSDYIDELGDTLDLVILGGYFGERRRIN